MDNPLENGLDVSQLYTADTPAAQASGEGTQVSTVPNATSVDAEAGSATTTRAEGSQVNQTDGLIASAENANSEGFDAVTRDVGSGELASDQLNQITSQSSPIIERARQEGYITAAGRGLLNSSIAAGSATGAIVDRALPLATQDAQTQATQALANQTAQNRAAEFGADASNTASLQDARLATDVSQSNAQIQSAVEQQNAQLRQDNSQFNASEANRAETVNAQLESDANIQNARDANAASFLNEQLRTDIAQANAQRQLALQQGNAQEVNRQTQLILDQNSRINQSLLQGSQNNDLATIQGRFNQLISTNNNAASLYNSYFDSISQLMANEDLSPSRLASQIEIQQRLLDSGLQTLDRINGIDLAEFEAGTSEGAADPASTSPAVVPDLTGIDLSQLSFGGP